MRARKSTLRLVMKMTTKMEPRHITVDKSVAGHDQEADRLPKRDSLT